MAQNNDSTFIGKIKQIQTKYGEIVKISLGPKDFAALETLKNESGWVNLQMMTKRDGGKYIKAQEEYKPNAVNATEDFPF